MQQQQNPCIYYEKSVAFNMRKGEKNAKQHSFSPFEDNFCTTKEPEKIISQTKCNCGCIYFDKKMTYNFSPPPLTISQNMFWESHRRRRTQKYEYNFHSAFATLLQHILRNCQGQVAVGDGSYHSMILGLRILKYKFLRLNATTKLHCCIYFENLRYR